ncbi:TRICHOME BIREFRINGENCE-LIKE 34 [Perilla frutescens var. frutescens]|nr:TRICHOME BIREFRINGENCE-LIKE 34 [Perilla frutescens var. frutescens]
MFSHSQTSMPHHPSKSDEVGSRASVEVKECKSPINEQIDMEYCESYVFHALYAYFDGDNVTLKGLAIHGTSIVIGEVNQGKLLKVLSVADSSNDPQLADFVEWVLGGAASVTAAALYLTAAQNAGILRRQQESQKQRSPPPPPLARNEERETRREKEEQTAVVNETTPSCNLFSGKWVYDNASSSPMYEDGRCSFMMGDYACEKYGRKDLRYRNWRWQPHHCDLPRFNGTALLEKIRGKRLVFVGDSLNRNQWTSMLCLIESSLNQSSNKSVIRKDNLFIFEATEYNATIEFYWSPLLVESNCDHPFAHSVSDRVVRITSIEKHARHWNDADILVFDSFMWWVMPSMTILWGSFEGSDAIYKRVDKMHLRLYEMALNTWSDWLEFNVNRTKTKLFFMSLSPTHTYGESWNVQQNCYNETEPISKEGYWGVMSDRRMMNIIESTIKKLEMKGLRIEYLNITHLSDYRKDAHPSIYKNFQRSPSEMQLADPKTYADCLHWCLPGVPDVWNHILYYYIMNS